MVTNDLETCGSSPGRLFTRQLVHAGGWWARSGRLPCKLVRVVVGARPARAFCASPVERC
eukprot:scaffold2529_cov363-Prasinococcus_capsulatus_cf.AAC.15